VPEDPLIFISILITFLFFLVYFYILGGKYFFYLFKSTVSIINIKNLGFLD